VAVEFIEPTFPPEQGILFCDTDCQESKGGLIKVVEVVEVHPILLVAVMVYEPADKLLN
jgi:hypothetical protein